MPLIRHLTILFSTIVALSSPALFANEQLPIPDSLLSNRLDPLTGERQAITIPNPPSINAASYILIDANSNTVLAQHNADERRAPASLTKVMTLYVIAQRLNEVSRQGEPLLTLDTKVQISPEAWKTGGSKMFVEVDTQVAVEDLIQGIAVQSGNDASLAIAEHIAGSEEGFALLMTNVAHQLGMSNTNFTNASGLPDHNEYSSARDIAILSQAFISNYPEYYHWFSQQSFTFSGIEQTNRNRLLRQDSSVDGIKTGFTNDAGYSLASSANRSGMRLVAIIMGAPDSDTRFRAAQALLNYGFNFFETFRAADEHQTISTARVYEGTPGKVKLGLEKPLYITLPRNIATDITTKLICDSPLKAPISYGDAVTNLQLYYNGSEAFTVPVIALEDSAKANMLTSSVDKGLLLFHGLFNNDYCETIDLELSYVN